jgi:hypothetical protein
MLIRLYGYYTFIFPRLAIVANTQYCTTVLLLRAALSIDSDLTYDVHLQASDHRCFQSPCLMMGFSSLGSGRAVRLLCLPSHF